MLDKAIKYKKEKRKEYRHSQRWDRTCRNHGSCKWCEKDRTHKNDKREYGAQELLRDFI